MSQRLGHWTKSLRQISVSAMADTAAFPRIYRLMSKTSSWKMCSSILFSAAFQLGFFSLGPGRSVRRHSSPKLGHRPSRARGFHQAGGFFQGSREPRSRGAPRAVG